jgi:hypothetical protein
MTETPAERDETEPLPEVGMYELKDEPKVAQVTPSATPLPTLLEVAETIKLPKKALANQQANEEAAQVAEILARRQADINTYKTLALVGYLCFLVPYLLGRTSRYARYHAQQALHLQVCGVVAMVVTIMLRTIDTVSDGRWPVIGSGGGRAGMVFTFGLVQATLATLGVLGVVQGMVNAMAGEFRALPVIGGLRLLERLGKYELTSEKQP